jgi:RNA polymerase sigma-70 factor (ECF subfamily)
MADEFATTRWTLVLAAAKTPERAREALDWPCQAYWRPLYSYVRRRGYSPEDAHDLVQGFFVEVLEDDLLKRVDPSAGRLRAYMLGAIKHHLSHQRERDAAQKRRAEQARFQVSLDDAETLFGLEADPNLDPAAAYDRRWALAVFERAMTSLAADHAAEGKKQLFDRLQGYLHGADDSSYRSAAEELGMTEGATKVAVHRMRARLGQLLRLEVSQTVASPEEVDDELRYLLRVL